MDEAFANAELGPKMQACSDRERKFVWHYLLNGGNGAQAARDAGYSDSADGAKVTAHRVMQRERVLSAIEEVGHKAFRGLLVPALAALRSLVDRPEHPDHSKVALSVLSRLGLGEGSTLNLNVSGEVQVNHTDAALEDLRRMLALGVPREKLVEIFGFSGLTRYERMLASQPKVLEHEPIVSRETDG